MDLTERHDKLDLDVTLRDQPVDMVAQGIDLAVRIGVLGDHPDLIARRLGEQHVLTCASPAYLARKGLPQRYADLSQHDCLTGWRSGARPSWLLKDEHGRFERHEVAARHELADGDALLEVCMRGAGLAQLPMWLAGQALQSGALQPVLPEISGARMPIHVIWQKTWHIQPKVRVTVDALSDLAGARSDIFEARYRASSW